MSGSARSTDARERSSVDPHAQQPPDTKQRTIEHGAQEYFRREGSPADVRQAGQPPQGGDAEPAPGNSEDEHDPER